MQQLLDGLLESQTKSAPKNESRKDNSQQDDSHLPTGGCVVALDVQSGAVLVAAGAPRFDFGSTAVPDAQTWKQLNDDPRHPLVHRAIQMALPPGSVFKVLSAVALLESRRIDPDVRFECRGYLDQPNRFRCLIFAQHGVGHGPVDLGDALSRSCNVYFFHAAGVIGPQPLVEWAREFGIGRPTGIDLPFERGGNLPEPDAAADGQQPHKSNWHIADTRALAIGQSTLTVTPLQIARMMAAIANGGYLVTPLGGAQSRTANCRRRQRTGLLPPPADSRTVRRNAGSRPSRVGQGGRRADGHRLQDGPHAGHFDRRQIGHGPSRPRARPTTPGSPATPRPSNRESPSPSCWNTPARAAKRPAPSPANSSKPSSPTASSNRPASRCGNNLAVRRHSLADASTHLIT